MQEEKEVEYTVIAERKTRCPDGRRVEMKRSAERTDEYRLVEVEAYLSDYRVSARMLEMNRYEREYFQSDERPVPDLSRETEIYLKARMYEIRSFVLSISDCDEKLFLYYYYVHGENLTRCAELLDVSRATVYRLRKRALRTAAVLYVKMHGKEKSDLCS